MKKCFIKDNYNMYLVETEPLVFSSNISKAKIINSKKHASNIKKWLYQEKKKDVVIVETQNDIEKVKYIKSENVYVVLENNNIYYCNTYNDLKDLLLNNENALYSKGIFSTSFTTRRETLETFYNI